ncbi:hypothetical protein [Streptomyces sp. NBC_00083]|nr:hypothetical protein [Streptomyces sp. NBC_00083]MCX5387511.1 hypothetical protein [Streptomyces sp. NBC_00083]
MSPTGKDQARWAMRWKTVLPAFDIPFDGRAPLHSPPLPCHLSGV